MNEGAHFAVFFDASQSMHGINKEMAVDIWNNFKDKLVGSPLTIETIHSPGKSQILLGLDRYSNDEIESVNYPNCDGWTYLWEFLVERGKKFRKITGEWIFILISDGDDNASSGKYYGEQGYLPCNEELKKMGIDIEWHIVGINVDDSLADVYRQFCGSTGGEFYRLEGKDKDSQIIKDISNQISIAIDEAIDPALRVRSRRRRQQNYLSSCTDSDLEVIELPTVVPSFDHDVKGEYERKGIIDLNPSEMETWELSLNQISGMSGVETQIEEDWSSSSSHTVDKRKKTGVRKTWVLDASKVGKILAEDPNKFFYLRDEISAAPFAEEVKSVIIRGRINERYEKQLNLGVRMINLPADLPPPPTDWKNATQFLENNYDPYEKGGWSMFPFSKNQSSLQAISLEMYHDVNSDTYNQLLEVYPLSNWIHQLGQISVDLSKSLQPEFWSGFGSISDHDARVISSQFNGFTKYLAEHLVPSTKVVVVRPDGELMKLLDENPNLQIEFLNKIDDVLELASTSKGFLKLDVEYWPALDL